MEMDNSMLGCGTEVVALRFAVLGSPLLQMQSRADAVPSSSAGHSTVDGGAFLLLTCCPMKCSHGMKRGTALDPSSWIQSLTL